MLKDLLEGLKARALACSIIRAALVLGAIRALLLMIVSVRYCVIGEKKRCINLSLVINSVLRDSCKRSGRVLLSYSLGQHLREVCSLS